MFYDKEHYNQVLEVARSYRNDTERLEKKLAITEKSTWIGSWNNAIWVRQRSN